jgi:membrane protein implicated in regulation of membrane protease activity
MVNQAVRDNATHVILQLEGTGGDWSEAEQLAHFLYNLRNPHTEQPVWTIAYFPARRDKQGALQARAAADTAALVALGCTDIVLGSEVGFGDFSLFVKDADRAQVQQALERLLKQRLCEPLLARGMLDPEATLYLVESIKGRQQRRVVTQEEWEGKLKDEERWRFLRLLVQRGEKRLVLTGQEALDLGVAQHRVEGFEPLCAVYGVDPKRVHNAGTGWLDNLAAFLTQPHVYIILILVGITCLILEFKIPGVTFPGVIAALCFVLFFWSQSHMAGSIGWLAALLFVLGLVLLAVEVFLIPGFGAAGICGILLVVGSLVLGIYNNQRTQSQSWSLEVTLGVFGLGLVGSIVAAIVLASYLPQIPGLNRLILKPQGEEGEATEGHTAPEVVAPQLAALLGAIGVAVTPLRPAGKVQFGEEFIDVVAETGYVNPGARVQVIEIEGNRVVVKEV